MLLCLDIGNTQMYGGVFEKDNLIFQFRKSSRAMFSSDEIGIFLRSVLRENNIEHLSIKNIAMCSVVPDVVYSVRSGVIKYFGKEPFILQAGVKTGLKIKYKNPLEVGSDRISNAIAAVNLYPDKNIITIDFGTATTFDVVNKNKEYLGGAILPGIKISIEALESKTAKLSSVEIVVPEKVVGKSTIESIQSGLFFGQLGMVKEITSRIIMEEFTGQDVIIIGTGGFVHLFQNENLFNSILPELVLRGLLYSFFLNN
ncbi:MAG: type III pantothenate kinase [Bacteroidota bacterium]